MGRSRDLTIDEVCERLHISRNHWNQLVYRREAPPRIKVSPRKYLVNEAALEDWLASRQEVVAS
ncbi:MAG TPA: hypothetical protein DEB55_10280 [Microbacterium sp.]|nr:hypothetical protein [Microbacterium sp.]|tara:strand:+ start:2720 stop:2911 length:192 start_codon:yes stop_codon:yes gene_type:complete